MFLNLQAVHRRYLIQCVGCFLCGRFLCVNCGDSVFKSVHGNADPATLENHSVAMIVPMIVVVIMRVMVVVVSVGIVIVGMIMVMRLRDRTARNAAVW